MTIIRFDVPGEAVGKGRPRAARRGNGITLYTPPKTVSYESTVALFGAQAMAGRKPLEGPVKLDLAIGVSIPQSWSKKKAERAQAGYEKPTKKPDLDNVLKAFGDALNGVVWVDDVQITSVSVHKFYDTYPAVKVMVTPMSEEA